MIRCPNCSGSRLRGGECCRKEISRLRSRVSRLGEVLDKLEAERDKYKRKVDAADTQPPLTDPWDELDDLEDLEDLEDEERDDAEQDREPGDYFDENAEQQRLEDEVRRALTKVDRNS